MAAERIFGYQAEEVLNQNVRILMPDPYQSEHDTYLSNYLTSGERKIIGIGREIVAKRKDGSLFPMELGVNEMQVDDKRMFVGTIRDISQRKDAEKVIQSSLKKLQLSNQELDQFAYIASHDLKEPLRGLSNNALFLEEDYSSEIDDNGKKRLARIRFLCSRMEELVDSLLYYSRLGRQELAIDKVELRQLVESVIELTLPPELNENVRVNIKQPLPTIRCDVPRIKELFRNLISNAVKYNQSEEKYIEIGTAKTKSPLTNKVEPEVFYVKDNGIGIDEQFHDDIFRIFKRLNQEDDQVRGTGVGLTFVKKIIERHEGQIWLRSKPGQGSCFYFTLNME